MPEFNLADAYLLVWPDTGSDLTAKVAAVPTGAVEISHYGTVQIQPTREATRLRPPSNQRRGRVVSTGGGGGTLTISVIRDTEGDDDDGAIFFDAIEASITGRFHWLVQPFRLDAAGKSALDHAMASTTLTPIPKASSDNALYQGSAVLTSYDPYGAGGEEPAVLQSTAELDRDYAVYRA